MTIDAILCCESECETNSGKGWEIWLRKKTKRDNRLVVKIDLQSINRWLANEAWDTHTIHDDWNEKVDAEDDKTMKNLFGVSVHVCVDGWSDGWSTICMESNWLTLIFLSTNLTKKLAQEKAGATEERMQTEPGATRTADVRAPVPISKQ